MALGRVEGAKVVLVRADVGKGPGRHGPGAAELVAHACGERVTAGERGVGEVGAERGDVVGVEPAAGIEVEVGEDRAGRDALAVAGDRAVHVGAEDVVAVAAGDGALDVGITRDAPARGIAGDDAVGDVEAVPLTDGDAATAGRVARIGGPRDVAGGGAITDDQGAVAERVYAAAACAADELATRDVVRDGAVLQLYAAA